MEYMIVVLDLQRHIQQPRFLSSQLSYGAIPTLLR